MKKLIAIAALAACLPAFSGQVASSNTVGYQKLTLSAGYTMCAPTFVAIGGQDISIQSLKPVGENIAGDGDVQIQIVTAEGNISESYTWFTAENTGLDGDYWCNDEGEAVSVTFSEGSAILIASDNDAQLLCPGEVNQAEVTYPLVSGFNAVGNAKVVSCSLQELVPSGDDLAGDGDVQVQVLNSEGNVSASYTWFTAENTGLSGDYWCDDEGNAVSVTLSPGEAFLICCDNPVDLTIPAVVNAD